MNQQEFDYVVVGGGASGCALAGRLCEDPNITVCVLEVGKSDNQVLVRMPLGFAATPALGVNNWGYNTVPQTELNGRRGYQPRGKVMGGSTSINAMVYTRGNRADYDQWAARGNPGWSYQDLLPLFKRSENNECFGATQYRGTGGPLNVMYLRSPSPLNEVFAQACVQTGIPLNPDYNAASQYGVSRSQVMQKGGERWNAARAYIDPHQGQKNLVVIQGALTTRVLLDGKRATGVEYLQSGAKHQVTARREVIVSGGAYGSPHLLMLSGIGPAAHLQQHGIEVRQDLPGVGQNLQDHLTTVLIYRTQWWQAAVGFSLRGAWALTKAIFEWRSKRTGWMTTNISETQSFISTTGNTEHPDIQLCLCTGIVDDHTRKNHLGHGFTVHATLMRPKSRGTVTLQSANPADAPLIDPKYLSHPDDLQTLVKGTQMAWDVLQAPAMAPHRGKMLYPLERNTVAHIEKFIRAHSDTEYHPVSTCKMGPASDPMAVVDHTLRVHGLQNLRVVDASVMPSLITGNTTAISLVIGEKAADMIKAGTPAG